MIDEFDMVMVVWEMPLALFDSIREITSDDGYGYFYHLQIKSNYSCECQHTKHIISLFVPLVVFVLK